MRHHIKFYVWLVLLSLEAVRHLGMHEQHI